jgi:TonB family protein
MECPQCKNPLSVENASVCEWCGNQLPIPEESFFSKIKRLYSNFIDKLITNRKRLFIIFSIILVFMLFLILMINWEHWFTENAKDSGTKAPIGDDIDLPVGDEVDTSNFPAKAPDTETFEPPEDIGPAVQDKPKEIIETFVDEEAEFPGGYPAMMAWIQKNLVFPETAIENNVQGKCFLRFVVSINGSISSVTVTKGVPDCPECDKAAIKAIRSMPNWKAGKLNGRSVSSYSSIPINFAIKD